MSILRKAFENFELEEFDEENRTFTGVATTINSDRVKDIVVPEGAVYTLPVPLCLHHKLEEPCGEVQVAVISPNQIRVKCQLPKVVEEGEVKKIVDKALHSVKYKLIKGMSIGFIPDWDEAEMLPGGGVKFKKWEWYELSLVTVPCNRESQIDYTKAFEEHKAALGKKPQDVPGGDSSEQKHVVVKLNSPTKGGVKLV